MCETDIYLDGEEIIKQAARIKISEGSIIIFDLLGDKQEIENAKIEEIDFLGHTTKITRK